MYEFRLPDIGEGLSEAEILEWLVKVGDEVRESDDVVLISTDKVNVDLTSPATGTVLEIIGEPGEVIPVGTLIMRIDDGREAVSGTDGTHADAASRGSDAERTPGIETGHSEAPAVERKMKAAPIVRRYAAEHDIDLSTVTGSGPGGQIMRRDIDAVLTSHADKGSESFEGKRLKLSAARLAAAKRLSEADRIQVATTISFEIRADNIRDYVQLLSESKEIDTAKVTPTAVVAKYLATALLRLPHFNATISETENELLMHNTINLGLAVNTEQGLLVPVIRGLEKMDIFEIATSMNDIAERARGGELTVNDMQGSTFTLSSTGSIEKATITSTAPIINYPNAAILWMSRINDRPRVFNGVLEAGPVIACSLSFDHRYLHGADGMDFVNELDSLISDRAFLPQLAC